MELSVCAGGFTHVRMQSSSNKHFPTCSGGGSNRTEIREWVHSVGRTKKSRKIKMKQGQKLWDYHMLETVNTNAYTFCSPVLLCTHQ